MAEIKNYVNGRPPLHVDDAENMLDLKAYIDEELKKIFIAINRQETQVRIPQVPANYKYDNNTDTDGNPGNGFFRFDNTAIQSATEFTISKEMENGASYEWVLEVIYPGVFCYVQNSEGDNQAAYFEITTVQDDGNRMKYGINMIDGTNAFTDGKVFTVNFF